MLPTLPPPPFILTPVRLRQGVEYLISYARYGGLRPFCKNPLCDLIISVALQIVCIVSYDAEQKQETRYRCRYMM